MKHILFVLTVVVLIPLTASSKNKLTIVKVEVVDQTSFQGKFGNADSVLGRRTAIEAASLRVIINGDHALLRCYENHQGCNTLGPGTYDAEVSVPKCGDDCLGRDTSGKATDPDVWIYYVQPLDHHRFREHWRVSGTW
jgi:hypothetical protein